MGNIEKKNTGEDIMELLEKRIIILDGAMGTMLQEKGLKAGECTEMWNLDHPDVIKRIHTSYLEAGADIVLTNTFGANGVKLRKLKIEEKLQVMNQQAVRLAREAADEYKNETSSTVFVAGSIGPTGEILEPYGPIKHEDTYTGYRDQIEAMVSVGLDLVILETFYNLDEIKIALKAVKENSDLIVFASMSFDDNLKTVYGVTPEKAVEVLFQEGADGVGANCGSGPEVLYRVLSKMRLMTNAPLMVEPNAGIPYLENNRVVYPATPEEMADYSEKFAQLKVNMIGGCCGSTPEHIQAIARRIKK